MGHLVGRLLGTHTRRTIRHLTSEAVLKHWAVSVCPSGPGLPIERGEARREGSVGYKGCRYGRGSVIASRSPGPCISAGGRDGDGLSSLFRPLFSIALIYRSLDTSWCVCLTRRTRARRRPRLSSLVPAATPPVPGAASYTLIG